MVQPFNLRNGRNARIGRPKRPRESSFSVICWSRRPKIIAPRACLREKVSGLPVSSFQQGSDSPRKERGHWPRRLGPRRARRWLRFGARSKPWTDCRKRARALAIAAKRQRLFILPTLETVRGREASLGGVRIGCRKRSQEETLFGPQKWLPRRTCRAKDSIGAYTRGNANNATTNPRTP
jgi:hypothetical protein